MHIHSLARTHTHTHMHTLIASSASLRSRHTCVHILTGAYTHTHTHTHTLLASSASLGSLHTCTYTHWCVYTHTHTHTHTHTPPQFCIPRIPACSGTTSSFSCLLCLLFPVFLPELLEDQEELKKAFLVCGVGRKALTTEDYQGIL